MARPFKPCLHAMGLHQPGSANLRDRRELFGTHQGKSCAATILEYLGAVLNGETRYRVRCAHGHEFILGRKQLLECRWDCARVLAAAEKAARSA